MQSWRVLRGRKREEQSGWGETPGVQSLPQAGSQNFLNWGPEGQLEGLRFNVCLSVWACLPGPCFLSLPPPVPSTLLSGSGVQRGDADGYGIFFPTVATAKKQELARARVGSGERKCGQGSRLLRPEAGLGETGGSLFLGKPSLTTPALGDCPIR